MNNNEQWWTIFQCAGTIQPWGHHDTIQDYENHGQEQQDWLWCQIMIPRLPHVPFRFLCAGLVQRSMRLKWSDDVITHYYVVVHIYGQHSFKRKYCFFPSCKWEYIHITFFPNWGMEQIHRGNILVKKDMQLLREHIPENVLSFSPKFSWSGLRSCLVMST